MRAAILPALAVGLIAYTGCSARPLAVHRMSPTRTRETDALHPELIVVPALAGNSTFGGVVKPDALAGDELRQLLERPLPRPADVPRSDTLIGVIERSSGRTVIWERAADTESGASIATAERWSFTDSFSQPDRQPTLRDALGVLLGRCNAGLVNSPAGIDYMFKNYAVIDARFIVIISLPVGAYGYPFQGVEELTPSPDPRPSAP